MNNKYEASDKNFNFFKMCIRYTRRILNFINIYISGFKSSEAIFAKVYRENSWGDPESRSGPGSSLAQTVLVKKELEVIVKELDAKSMLDIPCGDFNWLSKVDLKLEYTGADIVGDIINSNVKKYQSQNRHFTKLDLINDRLPKVDIVFCRDVLVHFNDQQIIRAISNIKKSNSKFLLTTTFPAVKKNINIATGEWRALDLCKPPFNFPKPIRLIVEQSTEENVMSASKCLGLWQISDI